MELLHLYFRNHGKSPLNDAVVTWLAGLFALMRNRRARLRARNEFCTVSPTEGNSKPAPSGAPTCVLLHRPGCKTWHQKAFLLKVTNSSVCNVGYGIMGYSSVEKCNASNFSTFISQKKKKKKNHNITCLCLQNKIAESSLPFGSSSSFFTQMYKFLSSNPVHRSCFP